MTSQSGFPIEILRKSIDDKMAYFQKHLVAHPKLLSTKSTLMAKLSTPLKGSIIFCIGPTGVGKSTLCENIEKELMQIAMPDVLIDPGRIPVARVELPMTNSDQRFDWRDFNIRCLEAVREVMIEKKTTNDKSVGLKAERDENPLETKYFAPDLRRALEKSFKYRKPTLLLDEGQHLGKVKSGPRLQLQMDCIKSLASLTKVTLAIFGTYEMLPMWNLTGQLARRSRTVHFERYYAERDEDIKTFKDILYTLQRNLPVEKEPKLMSDWDYIFERSIGCVGILKDLLLEALSDALNNDDKTVTIDHIKNAQLHTSQLQKIILETLAGENQLNGGKSDIDSIKQLLGTAKAGALPKETVNSNKIKRYVGQRRPTRDQVGVRVAAS